jgi:AdoMet-dependent heme synthase
MELLKFGRSCNNNCLVCGHLGMKAERDKTLAELEQEISGISDKGIRLPCNADSRKDFLDILAMLKKHGKEAHLESNGRVFSYRSFWGQALPFLRSIRIHIFGRGSAEHDAITRVPGSHAQALRGVSNTKAAVFSWSTSSVPADRLPKEVVIELTAKCNYDCIGCFNKISFAKGGRNHPEMSTAYVKGIIDSIAASGVERVRFSGGEPLLRADLEELMRYAREKGLKVWLNTNASLVDERYVRMLEKYVENVLVATNAADSECHSRWTKTDSFEAQDKGIRLLRGSKIRTIRSGTVATEKNIARLPELLSLVKEHGFDLWELWRPIPLHKDDTAVDMQKLLKAVFHLSLGYGKPIGILNSIPFCASDMRVMDLVCSGACYDDGHTRAIVDPRGFAKPSYFIDEDIGDPKDIMACWSHPFMKKMRNLELLPDGCRTCLYRRKCKGGSRYAAKLVSGSFRGRDPLMHGNI